MMTALWIFSKFTYFKKSPQRKKHEKEAPDGGPLNRFIVAWFVCLI